MKYFIQIVIVFSIFALFLIYCKDDDDELLPPNPVSDGYWIRTTDSYVQHKMIEAAMGTNLIVYIDENLNWTTQKISDISSRVLSAMDDYIYPTLTSIYGEPTDFDENNKVSVVITDIEAPPGLVILGFFDALNQFTIKSDSNRAYSNYAEIIYIDDDGGGYLDPDPFDPNKDLISTLAHEFFHLINYSAKVNRNSNVNSETSIGDALQYQEELWFDEGLAEVSSDLICQLTDMCSTLRISRIKDFSDVNNARLVYSDFNQVQDDGGGVTILKQKMGYSQSYIFTRFLADQLGSSDNSFQDLAYLTETDKLGIENINYLASQVGDSKLANFRDIYFAYLSAVIGTHLGQTFPDPYLYNTDLGAEFDVKLNSSRASSIETLAFYFHQESLGIQIELTNTLANQNYSLLAIDSGDITDGAHYLSTSGSTHTWSGMGASTLLHLPSDVANLRGTFQNFTLNNYHPEKNYNRQTANPTLYYLNE